MDRLDDDTAFHVLEFLDAAIDVAHVSLVSRSWRQFVLKGRLWRRLCLKEYPELERVEKIEEDANNTFRSNNSGWSISGSEKVSSSDEATGSVSSQSFEQEDFLEKEHRIFSLLYSELSGQPLVKRSCLKGAIAASSTDHWPREGIQKTLYRGGSQESSDGRGWSYWSSAGQAEDGGVPETLTYKLFSPLCVVHEIKIRAFQDEFEYGTPVYSPKFVKFRLGSQRQVWPSLGPPVEEYSWTYESPEYPVEQEATLQSFKLPRPVLCMGQILQIELLGRVQCSLDSLYYICVCHVSVTGKPILSFDFRDVGDCGGNVLIYTGSSSDGSNNWDGLDPFSFAEKEDAGDQAFGWSSFARRVRQFRGNNRLIPLVRRGER